MIKYLLQLYLILIFTSIYLGAQGLDSEIKFVDKNIDFRKIEIAESQIKKNLDKDFSYATAYVSLSKISLMKADNNNASKNANLADRIDEEFIPWWEELNSLRKKIQTGASSVKNNNYESALLISSELFVKYPNYPELPYYLAMTYYKQKKYKQASKYFQIALDLYPDYHEAKKALINVKKRTQN